MRDLLDDFEQPFLDRWRPARAFHLKDGCDHHELSHVVGRKPFPVEWSFQLRHQGLVPDVFGFFWHNKPFRALIVHTSLLRGDDLQIGIALHDLKGTWVTHPPVHLAKAPSEIVFDLAHCTAPQDREPFQFPLKAILMRCVGARLGEPYVVGLRRVELETGADLVPEIPVARHATAGDCLTVRMPQPLERAQILLLDAAGEIAADCEHEGDQVRLSSFLEPGRYRLEVWQAARCRARSTSIAIERRTHRMVTAHVADHLGAPALVVDGVPDCGFTYATYNPRREFVSHFRDAKVRVVSVPTTANHHVFDLAPTVTPAPQGYDARYLDMTIRTALDANPEALLLPRVYLGSAPWWDRAHSSEIGVAEDARGGQSPLCMTFVDTRLCKPSPSFSSPLWRATALADLERHLEHMAHAPYASQLVGFVVTGGSSEEWFHWYDEEQETLWGDVGPRHQEAFHRWLIDRYGSHASVERAWQRPLADRPIPQRSRREHSTFRLLRDPKLEQDVIDFYRFHAEAMADFLLAAARVVKQVAHGRFLVGAFYGYLLHFTGACRHLNGGHLALRRVLAAEVLDFLCAPTGYGHREPGDGFSAFMVPAGSVRLRGKLYYDENDLRTHLAPASVGYMSREYCRKEWGVTDDVQESIAIQRRELGHVLDSACPLWWFDLYPHGLYHEPPLRDEIAREVAIARTAFHLDRASAAEVAILVDEESCLHERPEGSLFWHCVSLAREPLARMGAPYQVFLLDDLPELPPHSTYVFLNAWAPSERVRAEVKRLAAAGRHLVFFGPAGIYRHGVLDWSAPADLIGMPADVHHEEGRLTATIEPSGRLAALHGTSFGPGPFPPPYVVPRMTTPMQLEARSPRGEPLIASLARGVGQTWFCATPCPPAEVLTAILRSCGVHVYCDSGDPIHASRVMLSIHARATGRKLLHLHDERALTDMFTGRSASARGRHHAIDMTKGETRLFFLGEADAWHAARRVALGPEATP